MVESGEFEIAVGSSSRDLPLREVITLEAPSRQRPLDGDSTLHEWLADERGRALLTSNGTPPLLQDPELIKVIGTMPMHTLAAFNMGFNHDTLKALLGVTQRLWHCSVPRPHRTVTVSDLGRWAAAISDSSCGQVRRLPLPAGAPTGTGSWSSSGSSMAAENWEL